MRTPTQHRLRSTGPVSTGAGPNARPRRMAPLSRVVLWRHRAQSTVLRTFGEDALAK